MSDSLCRVSIHADLSHGPTTVDLALPADITVDELMPSVVDLVGAGQDGPVTGWRLAHIGGGALQMWKSLSQHGIRDGDLLLLADSDMSAEQPVFDDECLAVTAAADLTATPAPALRVAICLWCTGIGAVVLVGAATTIHLVTAALLFAVAVAAAVVTHRSRSDPPLTTTLSCVAAGLAAVVGFLAVPAGPAAANFLLATAAAACVGVLLLRVTGAGTVVLTAVATFGATAVLALLPAAVWTVPTEVAGTVLATVSVGVLGAAARLTIMITGLTPVLPTGAELPDAPDPAATTGRARRAQRTLTGMVIGAAVAVTAGTAAVVIGGLHAGSPPMRAAGCIAVIGLVLLLRTRTHPDPVRHVALVCSGIISASGAFALFATAYPGIAPYLCTAVIAAGLTVVGLGTGAVPTTVTNPVLRRATDLLEYLALAVLVPLACWVVDLYSLARSLL